MKKKILIALCITIMMTMFMGCQSSSGTDDETNGSGGDTTESSDAGESAEKEVLTMMLNSTESDPQTPIYVSIIEEFNETNDLGVVIEEQFYENEQYKTKLATLMASDSPTDIFFTWELEYLEPFVRGGKVADITSYLEEDPEWVETFSDGTIEVLTYDDRVYAIPTQKTIATMFYNKEIFEENGVSVPETYEEFLQLCDTLVENGVTPMAMCGQDAWIPAQLVQQISNGIAGIELFDGINEGERKWNDPAHVEAGEEIQAMAEKGYFQDGFLGMGPSESTALFTSGQTAMYFQGTWDSSVVYQSDIGEVAGAFTLPAKNPEYNNISVGSVDTSFAIAEKCENKDAAIEFLKHWTKEENQLKLLYEVGRMPAGVFEIDESKLDPLYAEVIGLSIEQVALAPWWDRAFGAGEGTEFNNSCVAICAGEDPQEVFDELQAFAEANADR